MTNLHNPSPPSNRASRFARITRIAAATAGLALCGAALFAAPAPAEAFCGFYVAGADAELYNNATMVVMMRDGTRTVLAMQNNYQGPPEDFAMIVPVPVVLSEEEVKTLEPGIFDRVDQLAAPRLVEYWEQDPCYSPPKTRYKNKKSTMRMMDTSMAAESAADFGVTIEAEFTVAEYEIVVLGAEDSTGLDAWLRANNYSIPDGAAEVLTPYVQSGMKFFVAKVDSSKISFDEQGQAQLSPLRFHYDSPEFSLPLRLGLINSNGAQDLLVHILGKGTRYEAANYPNVTIPTNLEVKDETRARFGSFYTSLFDHTMAENPGSVVTEYSWAASSCDPCPVPALSGQEISVLGADVLPSMAQFYDQQGNLTDEWSVGSAFTLTRLHARYDRQSLGEDLVFREAPAIVGGREFMQEDGVLERSSRPSDYGEDNFQARYIIRHYWEGAVNCRNPRFGTWGGPPDGGEQTTVARDLAFAPRDAELSDFVTASAHTQLALGGEPAVEEPTHGKKRAQALETPTNPDGSSSRGCAHCSVDDGDSSRLWGGALGGLFAMFGLAGLIRRRRSN